MRKLTTTLGVAVAACASAAVAFGGGSVKTNVVVTDVRYSSAGKLELLGELRSRNDACLRSRKVAVFKAVFDAENDKKLGATEARRGSWNFTTREVDRDDYVYAKARRKVLETARGRVTCKGGQSGDFLVGGGSRGTCGLNAACEFSVALQRKAHTGGGAEPPER